MEIRAPNELAWAGQKKINPWGITLLIGSAHGMIFKNFSAYGHPWIVL
jgi:hypothetical protein